MIGILIIIIAIAIPGFTSQLSLPVNCTLGQDCIIQHYVDVDGEREAMDYRCGTITYDGHKGTDFRVINPNNHSMQVLASAPGIVKRIRNSAMDTFNQTEVNVSRQTACGNGVIIQHANGMVTQYCHLKKGSVIVQPNQRVKQGEVIGHIGQSGQSNFLHLHFSVRINGQIVDPFTGQLQSAGCGHDVNQSLWAAKSILAKPPIIYDSGYTTVKPTGQAHGSNPISRESAIQFYWVKMIGLKAGDVINATVKNGDGKKVRTFSSTIKKDWRHYFFYFGHKRSSLPWQGTNYDGVVDIFRKGNRIDRQHIRLKFKD